MNKVKKHKKISFLIPDTPKMKDAMSKWEGWIKSEGMTRDQALADWIGFVSKAELITEQAAKKATSISPESCKHELAMCECGQPYCVICEKEWVDPTKVAEAMKPMPKSSLQAYT